MPAIIKRLAADALAALGLFGAAATPASAEPALWAIRDGRSTIYLFGTVHMLKSGMEWQSPKIAEAFAESGELWLELTEEDPATTQPLVRSLGLDPAHPLSSKLSARDLARVDQATKSAGIPAGERALEAMRPWLAAVNLTVAPIRQAGYDPSIGVDHVLKEEAAAAGKKLRAFETVEQQLHFFADLPPALELQVLQATLDDVAEGPAKVNEMVDAWLDGDVVSIAKLFVDFGEPRYKPVYKVLIANRNQAWAAKLAERLKTGGGTVFVAVGAGHLAGPDSLIAALAQRGIKAKRE